MFTYRSRALLWVLLLMMILPVSALAAQKMDLQTETDNQGSHVTNESLAGGDNPAASRDRKDELNKINNNDNGDGDDDDLKAYGLIESFPSGLVGDWVIGGTTYTANADTEFEQEHGAFAVGTCVEIEYLSSSNGNTATEIETEEAYHCSGGSSTNQIYGTVESFPADLYGTWMVSGISYVASPSTQFEQDDGAFAVGNCVKVRYYTQNGVNQATKIESEDDSCGGGSSSGSQSINKVYATIDNFPSSPYVGTWQIGGLTYEATFKRTPAVKARNWLGLSVGTEQDMSRLRD